MNVPPQVLFLYSLMLIQSLEVLQSNALLLVLQLRLSIVLLRLLSKLLVSMQSPLTLFSDNLGVTYLSANPIFYSRMKHFTIDYHFVRDLVQSSELRVIHVFIGDQLADASTKSLFQLCLISLHNKIDVISGTQF